MNSFNSEIHYRHSIRLKGYDYSQAGLYFITICTQNRRPLFGEIQNRKMILNDAGRMVEIVWNDIPKHFPHGKIHEFVVMPNHVHGIIEIVGANNYSPLQSRHSPPHSQRPNGTSRTIGSMVRGFKIGVTKWFHENTDVQTVWQRNYYEHIIRDAESYIRISNYILNNPNHWQQDEYCA